MPDPITQPEPKLAAQKKVGKPQPGQPPEPNYAGLSQPSTQPATQPSYVGLPGGAAQPQFAGLPPGATITSVGQSTTAPDQQGPKSYWERLSDDLNHRRARMDKIAQRAVNDPRPGSTMLGLTNIVGQSALALTDIATEALVSGWRVLAPEEMKQFLTESVPDFLADQAVSAVASFTSDKAMTPEQAEAYKKFIRTEIGKQAVKALSQGYEAFKKFNDKFPEVGETLETLLGFSMLNVGKVLTREAVLSLSDATALTKNIKKQTMRDVREALGTDIAYTTRLNRQFSNAVRDELPRVINIAGKGKQTVAQKTKYLDKAEDAIKEIIYNKDNFTLKNLKGEILKNKLPTERKTAIFDFIQVIDQSKKLLSPEIEAALVEADATGKFMNFNAAIKSIEDFITSPSITSRPDTQGLIKSGEKMIEYYKQLDNISPSFAYENFIKDRNRLMRDIEGFLQPTISETEKAGLFAAELNGLNDSFKTILSESGNDVLKRYGNLLTIEGDVARLFRTAATDSGVDYATAYSAIEATKFATQGVHNPSTLGLSHVFARITKRLPEQRIVRMFKKGDEVITRLKPPEPVAPKSAAGKTFADKIAAFDTSLTP